MNNPTSNEQLVAELRKLHADILECDEGRESPMMALVRRAADALGSPVETLAPRTDHAENLARALEHYLNAHDTLSGVQSADEATGSNDASDSGFVDAANDAWRAMRTALHEYRKHSPVKSGEKPE
jgi:hypothetical protein